MYGGHASAMGPAPAAGGAEAALRSPVTFHERAVLPTRTWDGGPNKDHILESPRQRRRAGGLGRRWPAGHRSRDRRATRRLARAHPPPQRALPQPGRLALRGHLGEGGRRCGGLGQRRLRRRLRQGRPRRPVRHQLGPEHPVPQQGRRYVRGDRRRGRRRGRRLEHGLHVLRRRCRRRPRPVRRAVCERHLGGLRARSRTLRWRKARTSWWPRGPPGEADRFFENSATAASAKPPRARPRRCRDALRLGVVATDVDDDGAIDLFVANDSNPNFLYRNLGERPVRERWADGRRRRQRRGPRASRHGRRRWRCRWRRPGRYRADRVRARPQHPVPQPRERHVRGASLQAGLATITFQRMGWGSRSSTPTSTGGSISFIANGTSSPTSATTLSSARLRATQPAPDQRRGNFHDVSSTAGPGLEVARASRGLAVGDLDNDGDPDVVISNMDETPTLLENRQDTGQSLDLVAARRACRQSTCHRRQSDGHGGGTALRAGSALGWQLHVTRRHAGTVRARETAGPV